MFFLSPEKKDNRNNNGDHHYSRNHYKYDNKYLNGIVAVGKIIGLPNQGFRYRFAAPESSIANLRIDVLRYRSSLRLHGTV